MQKNAKILKQPEKISTPALKFFSLKPGFAVPGCGGVGSNRRLVVFGGAGSGVNRFGGAITKGDEIAVIAVFDNQEGDLKRRTVSELFKEFNGKIAPYSKLGKYFYDNSLWKENGGRGGIFSKASPMLTSTFGVLSQIPLGDLKTTGKGNIIIEGSHRGATQYIGPNVDQFRKAGINVEFAGVFLAAETGYKIVDANRSGDSYVIKSILKPEEIRASLLAFYGDFKNGQTRKTDNKFGIPVGDLA